MELFDVMSYLIEANATEGNIQVMVEVTEPYTDEKTLKDIESIKVDKTDGTPILVIK